MLNCSQFEFGTGHVIVKVVPYFKTHCLTKLDHKGLLHY